MRRKIGILLLLGFLGMGALLKYLDWVQATKAFTANNLIRLHVVANSDERKDQEIKHLVRDRIVEALRDQLCRVNSYSEARDIVRRNLSSLSDIAREVVTAEGCSYPVRVEWGRFPFPAKSYGNLTLPEGEYEAVRLVLGEGEGSNWWCVLFPPLCFVDISGEVSEFEETAVETLTQDTRQGDGERKDNTSKPGLKFRFLEYLQRDDGYLARIMKF